MQPNWEFARWGFNSLSDIINSFFVDNLEDGIDALLLNSSDV